MYCNSDMCCGMPQTGCAGSENRTVYACDGVNNKPLSATLRAESEDGVVWTKLPMHQVRYNGSTANNAVALNQTGAPR